MRRISLALFLALAIATSSGFKVDDLEWENFKITFGKSYDSNILETLKRFVFAVNVFRINDHNNRAGATYRLAVNQFSDFTFLEMAAMFPPTFAISSNGVPYTAPNVPPLPSFFYADQGFVGAVQNQGLVCNSGWAYASALAVQIFDASITGNLNSQPLSAQNLIDCAGGVLACRRQAPPAAFDYLTRQSQRLYTQTEYPNNPLGGQGMCVPPVGSSLGKTLRSYSTIPDGNDELLKSVVNYVAAPVIKLNCGTFEFVHYKEGVFTQPRPTKNAAQFVTVIGYDESPAATAGTRRGFWRIQNSFGTTWGEGGTMRIEMNPAKPIANSVTFPLE